MPEEPEQQEKVAKHRATFFDTLNGMEATGKHMSV
jgi:hypothetical protein